MKYILTNAKRTHSKKTETLMLRSWKPTGNVPVKKVMIELRLSMMVTETRLARSYVSVQ